MHCNALKDYNTNLSRAVYGHRYNNRGWKWLTRFSQQAIYMYTRINTIIEVGLLIRMKHHPQPATPAGMSARTGAFTICVLKRMICNKYTKILSDKKLA